MELVQSSVGVVCVTGKVFNPGIVYSPLELCTLPGSVTSVKVP